MIPFSVKMAREELLQKFNAKFGPEKGKTMEEAVAFATAVHEGQKRESGEPYIIHPIAVAEYLLDMGMDAATVIAGVLHDTVEDGKGITLDEIAKRFSPEVAHLVDGVTKLTISGKKEYVTKKQEQNENLTKLFLAIADDVRVVIIKLADRLHNMHTLEYCTREKQIRKAKETLEVYTPLAHRFGIGVLRSELEDLSFKYLMPEEYERIRSLVSRQQEERLKLLGTAMDRMRELMKEAGIDAELSGRPKHLYSTYRKMQRNNVGIGEIYDLIAIRVIVDTVNDCYAALGIIHAEWKPLPGRFKDYIAMPKPNMYRSLHTTLMNKNGIPFEVQIRTHEMHETAEYGVAAHWMYKEGRTVQTELDKRTSWLRQVVEEAKDDSDEDNAEFAENVVKDYLGEYVYVLTPKGEILDLPIGSTPLDFAYRIHTNVGHHTQHARVNGNMVRLDYTLKTNDVVEIITSNTQAGPSRDWLNIVKTQSAKNRIKQWFKKANREENIQKGREMLEDELRREVAGLLLGLERLPRNEHRLEELLLHVAHAEHPRRDAVDGRVEVVERDDEVLRAHLDDFLRAGAEVVVLADDVVGIPAHGARDVERDLAERHEERADLVGDRLREMEMAHVEKREDLLLHRVAHHELVRADGVAFDADAEELRLEERYHGLLVVLVLEDLV